MKILTGHVLRDHVVLGAIAAVTLLPHLGPWGAVEFWLAAVLIDIDHYLHFLYANRFKDWSIRGMFQFHHSLFDQRHRQDFLGIEIFHTVEFILPTGVLIWFYLPALKPVLWGILLHSGVDLIHLARHSILSKRAHSIVEFLIRRKRMEQRGLSISWLYRVGA